MNTYLRLLERRAELLAEYEAAPKTAMITMNEVDVNPQLAKLAAKLTAIDARLRLLEDEK